MTRGAQTGAVRGAHRPSAVQPLPVRTWAPQTASEGQVYRGRPRGRGSLRQHAVCGLRSAVCSVTFKTRRHCSNRSFLEVPFFVKNHLRHTGKNPMHWKDKLPNLRKWHRTRCLRLKNQYELGMRANLCMSQDSRWSRSPVPQQTLHSKVTRSALIISRQVLPASTSPSVSCEKPCQWAAMLNRQQRLT